MSNIFDSLEEADSILQLGSGGPRGLGNDLNLGSNERRVAGSGDRFGPSGSGWEAPDVPVDPWRVGLDVREVEAGDGDRTSGSSRTRG